MKVNERAVASFAGLAATTSGNQKAQVGSTGPSIREQRLVEQRIGPLILLGNPTASSLWLSQVMQIAHHTNCMRGTSAPSGRLRTPSALSRTTLSTALWDTVTNAKQHGSWLTL
ncbi:uncharacterized protein LOC142775830 [Rhipicephalus microplus]|uniref:uncharacterized protein LOC142775830 n=1 Tax=Rhipicephalus microplus TaxID=6941 RepID=UPI003F6D0F48